MALLSDGFRASTDDLRGFESSILTVAQQEGIDLDVKLHLAQTEIALDIQAFLTEQTADGTAGPLYTAEQVVRDGALDRWHVLRALLLTYQDAFSSYLNDRYSQKLKQYEQESERAGERYLRMGVRVVDEPLRRPASPTVTSESGVMESGEYWIAVTFVNARGEESEASAAVRFPTSDGSVPRVALNGTATGVVGWHVYGGRSELELGRQTAAPLVLGAEWVALSTGLMTGVPPTDGQTVDRYVRQARSLRRG